ncbi:b119.2 [Murid betaherpesvirus 8]|uniref:B119.2 n=2 Tax=Rat cytomegalovirus (isolate England) TaxID=1261657 RepID=K7XWE7_RCMVE|nr:e119.2 [Murid betaherpesvirus 8]AKE44280.1 a119.2 [Rat cytomegalovirus ALL-03]AFX83428.1 e119.2 [Murid betaherpesvirus 8]AKB93307.1 b119.2 [Murid betaherpesvirus 8]WEG71899.1 protein m119.2 [Murid betaherpesvirus 8]WPH25022.1 b119.2 [Murid betaherpesvirus 8]
MNDTSASMSYEANRTSLIIFDIIMAITSDGMSSVILYCFIMTLFITLAMLLFRLASMKNATLRIARRLGLIKGYQLYTICDKKFQERHGDGTEPATDEFKYIALKA